MTTPELRAILGVKGIRFGTGDEGFDWDDDGNVKR